MTAALSGPRGQGNSGQSDILGPGAAGEPDRSSANATADPLALAGTSVMNEVR